MGQDFLDTQYAKKSRDYVPVGQILERTGRTTFPSEIYLIESKVVAGAVPDDRSPRWPKSQMTEVPDDRSPR